MSDLCSCCLCTTSSNTITSPSSKPNVWNFAQVKKYQMNAYQEIIQSFDSEPLKQLQGSRSAWLDLCYQDPSAHTAHVWDCMTVGSHMTPPHLPSLLLPDPVNSCPCLQHYSSKGTDSKNCIKSAPVSRKKKKKQRSRDKILSPLRKLSYLFIFVLLRENM